MALLTATGFILIYQLRMTRYHYGETPVYSNTTRRDAPVQNLMGVGITVASQSLNVSHQENSSLYTNRSTDAVSVSCLAGVPCHYADHVDLRVIVLTYNRAKSLLKLLKSLNDLELDGDRAALEIWVDRAVDGSLHQDTLSTATQFHWSRGPSRVHIWDKHVGIMGQWIDTWRPDNASELAMILEDDLSVSPYAYRWLRAAHNKYGGRKDVAGYTFQAEGVLTATSRKPLNPPRSQTAILYQLLGTWGYAPHPERWRDFQDWFHQLENRQSYKPYVPGLVMTSWYKSFEKAGTAHTMWEMWHIHYCHLKTLYSVYSNLRGFARDGRYCLAINRKEIGLHFPTKGAENIQCLILSWKDGYIDFPQSPLLLAFNGEPQ